MKWFHEKWHGFFCVFFFYCLMILVYDDVIKYFFAVPSIFFLNLDLIWWRHFLSFYYHFFLDERKFLMAIWQKIIIVLLCAVNNFTWNDTVTFSILFDDNCHDAIMRELYNNSIFRIFESIYIHGRRNRSGCWGFTRLYRSAQVQWLKSYPW